MYIVEKFYEYTKVPTGYKVSLTPDFRAALDSGIDFEGWEAGTPLPNPGSYYKDEPVVSMSHMFESCKALSLDLTAFDASNLCDARRMFFLCESYELYFNNFADKSTRFIASPYGTSSSGFTNHNMFSCCSAIVYTGWSNIPMRFMFWRSNIVTLDLSSFDTRNVESMEYMFDNFRGKELDLCSFDTRNAFRQSGPSGMRYMFHRCFAEVTIGANCKLTSAALDDFQGVLLEKGQVEEVPTETHTVWFTVSAGKSPVFPCDVCTDVDAVFDDAALEEADYLLYQGVAEVPVGATWATVEYVENYVQAGFRHTPIECT